MTGTESQLAVLESALGPGSLVQHAPVDVDGFTLDTSFEPADGAALARGLSVLGECGKSVIVRGSGSRLAIGNLPRDPSLLLSMQRFDGIDVFDPEDGVVHAGAGTPLTHLSGEVAQSGWELPLDAPSAQATLGGVLAGGVVGPRVTGFGAPRDVILGLEVSLATGERTRCGGRVVKNVTGYDLAKIYAGSHGSLGVIEAAWLRLRPRAESVSRWTASIAGSIGDDAGSNLAVVAAARRPSVRAACVLNRSAALAVGAGGSACLVVELAGEGPATEEDASWLSRELGAAELNTQQSQTETLIDRIGAFQTQDLGEGGLCARIALLPSALAAATRSLDAAGFAVIAHPGPGLVYARFEAAPFGEEEFAAKLEALTLAAGSPSASLRFESMPLFAKPERDVFAVEHGAIEIARELKRRFDPKSVLNPGRGAGRL